MHRLLRPVDGPLQRVRIVGHTIAMRAKILTRQVNRMRIIEPYRIEGLRRRVVVAPRNQTQKKEPPQHPAQNKTVDFHDADATPLLPFSELRAGERSLTDRGGDHLPPFILHRHHRLNPNGPHQAQKEAARSVPRWGVVPDRPEESGL